MPARATYEEGCRHHEREWRALEARSRLLGFVVFGALAALALLAILGWGGWGRVWWGVAALAGAIAVVVRYPLKTIVLQERAAASRRFHELGLSRLDGTWKRTVRGGERFRSATHLYTDDLDVFGDASLFGHIDATRTRLGEERLAALLKGEGLGRFPEDVLARAEAVRELAANVSSREALFRAGEIADGEKGAKLDATSFMVWAEEPPGGGAAAWRGTLARMLWGALAAIAVALLAAYFVAGASVVLPLAILILVDLAIARALRPETRRALYGIAARHATVARYEELLAIIENGSWRAPLLRAHQAGLASRAEPGLSANRELGRLARIVSFVNARENGAFRVFVGPLLLWDVQWAIALDAWRAGAGGRVRAWLETVAEVEALASLAGFAFDRPDHAWPELLREPSFDAHDVAHPLLAPDARVRNDVRMTGECPALLLTGSNMSGKSTLLRAMGTNAILAFAGAPVCASSLKIGPLRVATSMRVRDSLDQHVSHFYAELLRLKAVLDLASAPCDWFVFFLLDEILHGTNSRERVLGGRSVVRRLLSTASIGAVSTHDLGLSALETELPGRVRNAHFEEQLEGGRMTFDYKLRTGVVQSSNALRLMQQVGIDVSDVLGEGPVP